MAIISRIPALPAFFLFILSGAAMAQNTVVDMPDMHVSTGDSGTHVVMPGMEVHTPPSAPTASPQPMVAVPVALAAPVAVTAHARASYANANMPGMNFGSQDLTQADFSNATLTRANFSGSLLAQANLANTNLRGADFSGAQLVGANLSNADLSGANLTNANLSNADLSNANLNGTLVSGAVFTGARLANVDMSKVVRVAVAPVAAPMQRPALVDSATIATALKAPAKKIDLTINFDFNSDKLTPDGAKQVAQIATALKGADLANSRIMVEGHTDNVGSDAYNKDLSYRRAMRVQRTLIDEYGVEASRLSAQGFGKAKPIASNDNDLGRAMNRRVTLINLGG